MNWLNSDLKQPLPNKILSEFGIGIITKYEVPIQEKICCVSFTCTFTQAKVF